MIVKLSTEHHLEFLSLKGSCTGSSESTHVKMPHCWKSHAVAHFSLSTTTPHEVFVLILHQFLLYYHQSPRQNLHLLL